MKWKSPWHRHMILREQHTLTSPWDVEWSHLGPEASISSWPETNHKSYWSQSLTGKNVTSEWRRGLKRQENSWSLGGQIYISHPFVHTRMPQKWHPAYYLQVIHKLVLGVQHFKKMQTRLWIDGIHVFLEGCLQVLYQHALSCHTNHIMTLQSLA